MLKYQQAFFFHFFFHFPVAKRERKRCAPEEVSQTEEDISEEEKNSLVGDTGKNQP